MSETEPDNGSEPEAPSTAEEWNELSREEQEDLLADRLDEERMVTADSAQQAASPQSPPTPTGRQDETVAEAKGRSARQLLEQKLEETWMAHPLDGVPVECRQLTSEEADWLVEFYQDIQSVRNDIDEADADDIEEIDDGEIEDRFDETEDEFLGMLADIIQDPGITVEWLKDRSNYPDGFIGGMSREIMLKHVENRKQVQQFRGE